VIRLMRGTLTASPRGSPLLVVGPFRPAERVPVRSAKKNIGFTGAPSPLSRRRRVDLQSGHTCRWSPLVSSVVKATPVSTPIVPGVVAERCVVFCRPALRRGRDPAGHRCRTERLARVFEPELVRVELEPRSWSPRARSQWPHGRCWSRPGSRSSRPPVSSGFFLFIRARRRDSSFSRSIPSGPWHGPRGACRAPRAARLELPGSRSRARCCWPPFSRWGGARCPSRPSRRSHCRAFRGERGSKEAIARVGATGRVKRGRRSCPARINASVGHQLLLLTSPSDWSCDAGKGLRGREPSAVRSDLGLGGRRGPWPKTNAVVNRPRRGAGDDRPLDVVLRDQVVQRLGRLAIAGPQAGIFRVRHSLAPITTNNLLIVNPAVALKTRRAVGRFSAHAAEGDRGVCATVWPIRRLSCHRGSRTATLSGISPNIPVSVRTRATGPPASAPRAGLIRLPISSLRSFVKIPTIVTRARRGYSDSLGELARGAWMGARRCHGAGVSFRSRACRARELDCLYGGALQFSSRLCIPQGGLGDRHV